MRLRSHVVLGTIGVLFLIGSAAAITGGRGISQQGTFLQSGANAVLRTIESKERDIVSVKDFGAAGDGSTDDTTAVQNCLNSGGSGSVVCEMPHTASGYRLATLVTLAKNSTLRVRGSMTVTTAGIRVPDSLTDTTGVSGIECPERAAIKLANSANVDLIANTNFATLSGTGNQFGTFRFRLASCKLDGNKANQTALVSTTTQTITTVARSAGGVVTITMTGATTPAIAAGMTVNIDGLTNDNYSFNGRFIVQSGGNPFTYNQTLRNTVGSTGATGAGTVKGYSGPNGVRIYGRSGYFEALTVANNILDGMWHEGYTPSSFTDDTTELETVFRSIRIINNGGDGLTFWGPQNSRSIDGVGFNNGQWGREIFQSMFDVNTVSYLNSSGSLHIGSGGEIQQTASQETSAAGWGILIDLGSAPSGFSSEVVSCNGCTGIEFKSPTHVFNGIVQNSTIGIKFNGGGATMSLGMTGNTTWFDCTSENGNVIIDLNGDNNGTMKGTGCWTGSEVLRVPALAGNTTRAQFPGALSGFFIGGWNPVFPASNGTLMVPDVAQVMTASFRIQTVLQAALGTPTNGTIVYCSDCTTASACTGGGTGAFASRQNGAWKCL